MHEEVTPRKANRILSAIGVGVLGLYCKTRFDFSSKGAEYLPKKGAYYVFSTHGALLDCAYTYIAMKPHKPHAIVNDYFFCSKFMSRLMTALGCISKHQFVPDPMCIRRIDAVIRDGHGILLFPEGQVNGLGFFDGFPHGIGKLVKRSPAPVFAMKICGDYLAQPKWGKRARRGEVHADIVPLFTLDEVEKCGAEEIENAVLAAMRYDEYAVPRRGKKSFHAKKLTDGFDSMAYICPKCGEMFTLETTGGSLYCTSCGNSGYMDEYARFIKATDDAVMPHDAGEWFRMQMEFERHELARLGETYKIECAAEYKRMAGHGTKVGYEKIADGKAVLSPRGIEFYGKKTNGEDVSFTYPLALIYKLPFTRKGELKLPVYGAGVSIQPHDVRQSARWLSAWNALKAYDEEKHPSPGKRKHG